MKQKNCLITLLLLAGLTILYSCSPMYQVLETSSPDAKFEKDNYVFENTDIKINYNFWTDGGSISFFIFNKLDEAIYIDWDKSHLIYNGTSYEYWFDSEETKSFYSSASQTNSYSFADALVNITSDGTYATASGSSNGNTATYKKKSTFAASSKFKPKKIIQIPPKSGIFVSKFSISKSPYFTCDFNLKPIISSKTVLTKNFSQNDSPLNFRNYITYSTKESFDVGKNINNEFYISVIHVMNLYAFQGKTENYKYCKSNGEKVSKLKYPYPYKKANSFYIKTQQK